MSVYGYFQPSVLGMESHSRAIEAVATNIANVRTGGYKRTEIEFATVLSRTISSQPGSGPAAAGTLNADMGGVRPIDRPRISVQGEVSATGRKLDVALDGRGFFVLNTAADGAGREVYGRDGRFAFTAPADPSLALSGGYLVDKNGYYLQGWEVTADGTLPDASSRFGAIELSPHMLLGGQATTSARLALNLPAVAEPAETFTYAIDAFDNTGTQRGISLEFTRSVAGNIWDLGVVGEVGDVFTVTPLDGTGPAAQQLVFGADGYLQSPPEYTIGVTHADGAVSSFSLDVTGMTQFGKPLLAYTYEHDGYAPGVLESLEFSSNGQLIGRYDNGQLRNLFQLAIADFVNADGLAALNGNVYAESELSGAASYGAAGTAQFAAILPEAHELSNVDIAHEFTQMTKAQHAYNASATSFRTLDEMTQTARDLKA